MSHNDRLLHSIYDPVYISIFAGITGTSGAFVLTVKTDNTGDSNNDQFTLPLLAGEKYSFRVSYDGRQTTHTTSSDLTLTFPSGAGTYNVSITGTFSGLKFNNGGDRSKITDIVQFGTDAIWTSLQRAFFGCDKLVGTYTDAPTFSGHGINGLFCFRDCLVFVGIVDNWPFKYIGNAKGFLRGCKLWNKPVNSLDMSNITSLEEFWLQSDIVNQSVSNWSAPNNTSMRKFVKSALAFNQDISHLFTSAVTDAVEFARLAGAYDKSIGDGDITGIVAPGMTNAHTSVTLSTAILDDMYNKFDASGATGLTFNGGTGNYSAASSAARASLVVKGWILSDGGLA